VVTSDSKLKAGAFRRVQGAHGFYSKALSAAEQIALAEAMEVVGLDEEIALLRLRLQQAVREHPKDVELMFKGALLLARLVATKFRLSPPETADLAETIQRAVVALNQMEPEATDDSPV
jgi:hypothetical protein